MRGILRAIGSGLHSLVNTTLALCIVAGGLAFAHYQATQGSGTYFGSIARGGVEYAQQLVCDYLVPTQCLNVTSSGEAKVIATGIADAALVATNTGAPIMCLDQASASADSRLYFIGCDNTRSVRTINWAIGTTGSTVATASSLTGINVAGNNRGLTGGAYGSTFAAHTAIVDASGNQITAFSNASVGATGAAVPSSATLVGFSSGGNNTAISTSNPLPVQGIGLADSVAISTQTGSMVGGYAETTPTAVTTGDFAFLSMDPVNRNLRVAVQAGAAGGWTKAVASNLSNAPFVVKSGAGILSKVYCYNPNSSVVYLQVFDTSTSINSGSLGSGVIANGGIYGIAATSSGGFAMDGAGDQYSTGIRMAATTGATNATAPSSAITCTAAYN